jgi:hypothetical protein
MSKLNSAPETFYFISALFDHTLWDEKKVMAMMAPYFEVDEIFRPNFNPSLPYYTKEMGPNLTRLIFTENKKRSREYFIELKKQVTEIELSTAVENKRTINLDPGQLNLENMLLATGKPYAHRVYLAQGVYADLNYIYQNKTYQTLAWTYPDYAHIEKISFFNQLRSRLY